MSRHASHPPGRPATGARTAWMLGLMMSAASVQAAPAESLPPAPDRLEIAMLTPSTAPASPAAPLANARSASTPAAVLDPSTVLPASAAGTPVTASPSAVPAAPLSLRASLATLRARLQPWRTNNAASESASASALRALPDVRVIELPREGGTLGPPPKRAHHALSIGMEGPKQMLRGLGLDATECAARLRMPSKLNRGRDGATNVEISAQLGMGCKF